MAQNISAQIIQQLAKLANLQLSETEMEDFNQQLSQAFSYFAAISAVPTEGVEPLVTPAEINLVDSGQSANESLLGRADFANPIYKSAENTQELLANAPARTGNLFTVPPVV